MTDIQKELFAWVGDQSRATGVMLFLTGIVYAFHGFRVFRFLLALSSFALGWGAGMLAASYVQTGDYALSATLALVCAVGSLRWERPFALLVAAATWGAFAFYFSAKCTKEMMIVSAIAGVAALLGLLFARLCYRTMTVIVTTMQGVGLIVVGFVGGIALFSASLTHTLKSWALDWPFLIPMLAIMLFAAAFSYQSMLRQGDICSGQ